MAQAYNYYVGTGSQTAFEFTQEMNDQATVVGVINQTITSGTWDSLTGFFTFDVAPVSGQDVYIVRQTSNNVMVATYPNKSYISSENLDADFRQYLMSIQEAQFWNDQAVLLNAGAGGYATAAAASAAAALASEVAVAGAEAATAADAAATAADVITTSADAASAAADAIDTAADVVTTNADAASTAADLVATNQDTLDTAADAVATAADRVVTTQDALDTAADAVATAADVVATNQDAIDTAADAAEVATAVSPVYDSGVIATAVDYIDIPSIGLNELEEYEFRYFFVNDNAATTVYHAYANGNYTASAYSSAWSEHYTGGFDTGVSASPSIGIAVTSRNCVGSGKIIIGQNKSFQFFSESVLYTGSTLEKYNTAGYAGDLLTGTPVLSALRIGGSQTDCIGVGSRFVITRKNKT